MAPKHERFGPPNPAITAKVSTDSHTRGAHAADLTGQRRRRSGTRACDLWLDPIVLVSPGEK